MGVIFIILKSRSLVVSLIKQKRQGPSKNLVRTDYVSLGLMTCHCFFASVNHHHYLSCAVDSIRWFRPDCIAVGCFQLNDDGEKENYIVQLITSRGRITDVGVYILLSYLLDQILLCFYSYV